MAEFAYRLKAGQHIQTDPEWEPSEGDDNPRAHRQVYNAGQVVPSNRELDRLHGRDRFVRLSDDEMARYRRRLKAQARHGKGLRGDDDDYDDSDDEEQNVVSQDDEPEEQEDDLWSKTVTELKQLAESEGIQLTANRKDRIIQEIRQARGG